MKLVPFGVVLGRGDDQALVELIEARWREGRIPGPVLGRRGCNHMHEEIENYHRFEIQWCAAAPKRDYYEREYDSEAYAHPPLTGRASVGADYYSNIWKDIATTGQTLRRLRAELTSAPLQPEIRSIDTSQLLPSQLKKETCHQSIAASDLPANRHWKPLAEAVGAVARCLGVSSDRAWAALKTDIAAGEIKARCRARRYDQQQGRWIDTWRDLDPQWLGFIAYECPEDNHLCFDPAAAIRARMIGERIDLPPEHARDIAVDAARFDGRYPPSVDKLIDKLSPSLLNYAEAPPRDSASAQASGSKPVKRRPSRQKPFWSDARRVAFDWLDENGYPLPGDGGQAGLERHIAAWLTDHGYTASESTIRKHTKAWIEEYKASVSASG